MQELINLLKELIEKLTVFLNHGYAVIRGQHLISA